MDVIAEKHKALKKIYDKSAKSAIRAKSAKTAKSTKRWQEKAQEQKEQALNGLKEIASICLEKLWPLKDKVISYPHSTDSSKNYIVYTGTHLSRPVESSLFIKQKKTFEEEWDKFISKIDSDAVTVNMPELEINKVLYTAIMSFAICYDLWKNKSRKTPGTHFEVLLGCVFGELLPNYERKKFVILPGQEENVSTDIVFEKDKVGGIVIPAKITTRERVVQPYAHQRILDGVFEKTPAKYSSILVCVSETQRDDKTTSVNDICVPGTIKLFQTHLSKLSGFYYLDPPKRYKELSAAGVVKVNTLGTLMKSEIKNLLAA